MFLYGYNFFDLFFWFDWICFARITSSLFFPPHSGLPLPCLALPCLALPPPAVTLRWLAVGLPLRDCRLRSRYTPGRLGFFNSPCLALPCLALPLPLPPIHGRTQYEASSGAGGDWSGGVLRPWVGFPKGVCPRLCPLFFSLALVSFSSRLS